MEKKLTQKISGQIQRFTQKVKSVDYNRIKAKSHAILLGNSWKYGLAYKIAIYFLLIIFGFVFMYPLIYMMAYSFMSPDDVINPFVTYLPRSFYFENFKIAFKTLRFFNTLFNSLLVSVLPALLQCLSASLCGYGLARFRFPGKNIVIILIVVSFIIPQQLTMIPQLIMFTNMGMSNILSVIIPAFLGQGLQSTIFILIFFQFYRTLPKSLEEAAKIDGANTILIFIRIACPLVLSGFILTFLFSFVWYFNETSLTSLFFGTTFKTLPLQLRAFADSWREMTPSEEQNSGRTLNEAVYMAGTFISILPLLAIYFAFQRFFIESVEKAGITGE